MFDYEWSDYQKEIFRFVKNNRKSLFIEAVAGSGKSSCLKIISRIIPKTDSAIFLAFNRHIKTHLQSRLPHHFTVKTFNGLGHSAVLEFNRAQFGQNTMLDSNKVDNIVQYLIEYNERLALYLKVGRGLIRRLVGYAKMYGILPSELFIGDSRYCLNIPYDSLVHNLDFTIADKSKFVYEHNMVGHTPDTLESWENIIDEYSLDDKIHQIATQFSQCESVITRMFINYARQVLAISTVNTLVIDYADQIYFPIVYNMRLHKYDWVIIDECFPKNCTVKTSQGNKSFGGLYFMKTKNKPLPKVLSFNLVTNKMEYRQITNVFRNKTKKSLMLIRFNGGVKARSTKGHRFYVEHRGWVTASKLGRGDIVYTNNISQRTKQPLEGPTRSILAGSILGDGGLCRVSDMVYRLTVRHCSKQSAYCIWKSSFFIDSSVTYRKNQGYSSDLQTIFTTKTFILPTCDTFSWALSNFDALSLAILYMDDGSVTKAGFNHRLHINSFTVRDAHRINEFINRKFGLCGRVVIFKNKYPTILYKVACGRKLEDIIAKYVPPVMRYKLRHTKQEYVGVEKLGESQPRLVVLSTEEISCKEKYLYDIAVECNNNYFVFSRRGGDTGVLVHNCQDTSILNLELVKKSVKDSTVVIAAGDRDQQLYAWRGADSKAIDNVIQAFDCTSLPLSICYRCPKTVVAHAQTLNKQIEHWDNQVDGDVIDLGYEFDVKELKSGDMVLSRYNAVLLQIALSLIDSNVGFRYIGKNFLTELNNLLSTFQSKTVSGVCQELNSWYEYKIKRIKALDRPEDLPAIRDKYSCLKKVLNRFNGDDTLFNVNNVLTRIFNSEGECGVCLSTVHKAKGLEADTVYVVDRDKMAQGFNDMSRADRNIAYVAVTRAKKRLVFIRSPKEFRDEFYSSLPFQVNGKIK